MELIQDPIAEHLPDAFALRVGAHAQRDDPADVRAATELPRADVREHETHELPFDLRAEARGRLRDEPPQVVVARLRRLLRDGGVDLEDRVDVVERERAHARSDGHARRYATRTYDACGSMSANDAAVGRRAASSSSARARIARHSREAARSSPIASVSVRARA